MPKPNYGYEKRQKELAKQRKKEDKLKARAERKANGDPAVDGQEQAVGEDAGAPPEPLPPQG